ncbi:MAG: SIS domain-containing protein, partial [bacterium]|nr:SIS domain-containing protein [bacterium]
MSAPTVIEGPYLADILAQPRAVRETLQALPRRPPKLPAGFRKRLIVLTGMGSSLYALHPLRLRLNRAGIPSVLLQTSELLEYGTKWLGGKALVVVSQSGRSVEVVRLLGRPHGDCPVIGVTNDPDSPLAKRSDVVVETSAGSEFSVSTKTYVATLAALAWLGDVLCGEPVARSLGALGSAGDEMERYLAGWREHVESLLEVLGGVRHLFYLGRAEALASVLTAGLITKESTHVPAEGMSAGAFRHGPFEMVDPSTIVVVFSGAAREGKLNLRLVDDIRRVGGRAEVVGTKAEREVFRFGQVSRRLRPLLDILPVEMITLALAALTGREAG